MTRTAAPTRNSSTALQVQRYLSLGLAASILACAPGDVKAGLGPNEPEAAVVVLAPTQDSIVVGQVVLIAASARTSTGQPAPAEIDWSASGGNLLRLTDSTAQFSASESGSYVIYGRDRKAPDLADSTRILVTQDVPPVVSVSVSPSAATLAAEAVQAFVASASRQDSTTLVPDVVWSATGGSITSNGLYTAGNTAGTFRVIATQQGGSLADTATISIVAAPPPSAQIYFEDGFESGGLGGTGQAGWRWGQVNGDAGFAPLVSSQQSKTGARSLQFAFKGGPYPADSWSEQRFVMGGGLTEVYVRFWLYVPSNYAHRNTPSSDNNKFFRVWATDYAGVKLGSSLFPASSSNPAAGSDLGLEQAFNGGSMGQYNLPVARGFIGPADYGKWMRVQLYFKLDTGGGNARMRVWKNNVLVLDSGNFTNPAGSLANVFTDGYILGWSNSGFDALTTLYVDDFVMSNYPE